MEARIPLYITILLILRYKSPQVAIPGLSFILFDVIVLIIFIILLGFCRASGAFYSIFVDEDFDY